MARIFSPEQRSRLRSELLEWARVDSRLSGAAITGSAADGREDAWSDIDLAFGVAGPAEVADVLSDWTARMYGDYESVHHYDVRAGAWIYRVFLLRNTLQVDLAFVPEQEFRALAPTFRLVMGSAQEARSFPALVACDMIGLGWLYALHARSSLARGKWWQAEYMISGVRDQGLALACLRHGVPAIYGKGIDLLPGEVTAHWEEALVRRLAAEELSRAFKVAVRGLLAEARFVDQELTERLEATVLNLCNESR